MIDFLITSAKIVLSFGAWSALAIAAGASPAILLPIGTLTALFVCGAWHNTFR